MQSCCRIAALMAWLTSESLQYVFVRGGTADADSSCCAQAGLPQRLAEHAASC